MASVTSVSEAFFAHTCASSPSAPPIFAGYIFVTRNHHEALSPHLRVVLHSNTATPLLLRVTKM